MLAEKIDYNEPVDSEIEGLSSIYEILKYTRKIANKFGYQYYLIMGLHDQTASTFSEAAVVNNWPTEIIAIFNDLNKFEINNIINSIKSANLPFHWHISALEQQLVDCDFEDANEIFATFSFKSGVFFPVYCPKNRLGAVSFIGDREPLSTTELASLSFICTQIYDQVEKVSTKLNRKQDIDLSAREMECLRWTARGKTSAEIAKLLNLSNHTVKHYLVTVCQKLNALNRVQAVANAIRAGLLE